MKLKLIIIATSLIALMAFTNGTLKQPTNTTKGVEKVGSASKLLPWGRVRMIVKWREGVISPTLFDNLHNSYDDTTKISSRFGFGVAAKPQDIAKLDIAIRPDGKGLPVGQGDVAKGKALYVLKCTSCHGQNGTETPGVKLAGPALVGDTSAKSKPKTIGNYWPYATTLFDYMRRTMPYDHPGSLTDSEVYSLTAYLLNANKIITADVVLDAKTLPKIMMPAKKLFIADDRKGGPEVK